MPLETFFPVAFFVGTRNYKTMKTILTDPFLPVDEDGFYGRFGGAFIPEILHSNIEKLKEAYARYADDAEFNEEYEQLLSDYVGRPTPLYHARRLSETYGANIYLKREDLCHTGPIRLTMP